MKTLENIQNFLDEVTYSYFWKEQFQVIGIAVHHTIISLS